MSEKEWIPVSDRLPNINQRVLVSRPRTSTQIGYIRVMCEESGVPLWKVGIYQYENVTHWMPLPEPPKPTLQGVTEE